MELLGAAFHWVTSSHVPSLPRGFQYVEVPGNHYIHMNQPQQVAGIISSFYRTRKEPQPPWPWAWGWRCLLQHQTPSSQAQTSMLGTGP